MTRFWGMHHADYRRAFALGLLIFSLACVSVFAQSPFGVSVAPVETDDGSPAFRVQVRVPAAHFVYADEFRVRLDGDAALEVLESPVSVKVFDPFSEEEKQVFDRDFSALYRPAAAAKEATVIVELQGCDETVCFFPETHRFSLRFDGALDASPGISASGPGEPGEAPQVRGEGWRSLADRFSITARDSGYLRTEPFLAFLDRGLQDSVAEDALAARFKRLGMTVAVLLILLGGAGLNLTPCVLPLVPINLAIIGAGAKAGSKSRGFLLGAAYGLGMAFVYGVLGLVAVLTGSTFGALNASPWFNLGIAVVFVILSLAMFDVISIDFTRFQGTAGSSGKGRVLAVCGMGAVAALLAGACVAPVVISVLLLSGTLYSQGNTLALLLPFLLGVGMGLPWPFAGAGMGLLPKPGRWMNVVKYVFGVVILAFAFYYGRLAYGLFRTRAGVTMLEEGAAARTEGTEQRLNENERLALSLQEGLQSGKPMFIDFWATWCKNCIAMEKSTFQEPEVKAAFERFVVVKYQAEQPNEPSTKEVLEYFGAAGLPTYVVLVPKGAGVR
ncbi:MAG: Thiol:disulfide interchange protein DsbD precursor [Verrucomicrobia bacterium ADurb.Bin345]|nr:MAG: Thiol:disulfide interchange protein DsbD precursor [Verrucomicrobia bacterium ADurb.Bin345]